MSSALDSVPAADGYPLRHRVWAPGSTSRATVIAWSGVMSHSAWLAPIAELLAGRGFTFVGADRRGSGPNREALGDAPSAELLIDDALRIAGRHPDPRRFLLGWCWGASLALNATPKIEGARGLILIAPGLWPTGAVEAAARAADQAAAGAPEDQPVVATPIAEEMFTRGPALDAFVRADPLRLLTVTPRFRKVMGRLAITAAVALRRCEVPVLAILADGDEATDSDAAERALSSRATVVRIPGPHGLMFERADELAGAIAAFIEERL